MSAHESIEIIDSPSEDEYEFPDLSAEKLAVLSSEELETVLKSIPLPVREAVIKSIIASAEESRKALATETESLSYVDNPRNLDADQGAQDGILKNVQQREDLAALSWKLKRFLERGSAPEIAGVSFSEPAAPSSVEEVSVRKKELQRAIMRARKEDRHADAARMVAETARLTAQGVSLKQSAQKKKAEEKKVSNYERIVKAAFDKPLGKVIDIEDRAMLDRSIELSAATIAERSTAKVVDLEGERAPSEEEVAPQAEAKEGKKLSFFAKAKAKAASFFGRS
ncbi:MAG TPA: hypothetical protein VEB60_00905 [Candidatus Paceibacterota bacterium]|nr:hypothetical protein [Candidatus Paceibacterota bacterium]